ncbi:acyl-CoA thioesterase [Streptomyces sp. NPDC050564]|uniref:acyl-CoA thioesterase n=1 Tax=Streptomyces sp. NPDC050564 TaxID=3365631 RepID=UPI0037B3EEC9
MSKVFKKCFEVRWDDVDLNGHLRNTRYLEYAATARLGFLIEWGWSPRAVHKAGFAAVTLGDEVRYVREVFPAEVVTVAYRHGNQPRARPQAAAPPALARGEPHRLAARVRRRAGRGGRCPSGQRQRQPGHAATSRRFRTSSPRRPPRFGEAVTWVTSPSRIGAPRPGPPRCGSGPRRRPPSRGQIADVQGERPPARLPLCENLVAVVEVVV